MYSDRELKEIVYGLVIGPWVILILGVVLLFLAVFNIGWILDNWFLFLLSGTAILVIRDAYYVP